MRHLAESRWHVRRTLAVVALGALSIATACGGDVDKDGSSSGGASSGGSAGSTGGSSASAGTGGTGGGTPGPCDGKQCGDACAPCTAGSPGCQQGKCNSAGECTDVIFACGTQCTHASDCPPPPPVCHECPSGTSYCPGVDCENGFCVTPPPDCGPSPGYDPCEGSVCGADCQLCNPIISSCIEPPGDRRCTLAPDGALRCTLGPFPCPK